MLSNLCYDEAEVSELEEILLLHTNDLHSHLENWPQMRRYLTKRQQEMNQPQKSVITIDLGDFVDRWHALSEATQGQANVALMNQGNYDVVTIGNNEGLGNSKKALNELYEEANFEVLLANLFDQGTLKRPRWAKPYKIITTALGTKVGLIALTAYFPLTYAPNGWDIRDPLEILPELVLHLRPQVDVLVVMSHLGIDADHLIAKELPQVDVVLGSHTHHLFPEGKRVNGVQLAAAGKHGKYIGEVSLFLENNQLIQTKATTIETAQLPKQLADEQEIQGYLAEGEALLTSRKVAQVPRKFVAEPFVADSLLPLTLAAMNERAQTEVAIVNSGLFLTDLASGLVTQADLHRLLPHPMHLIKVDLTGRDVRRLVFEIEKNRNFLRNFPIMGMGFRGKIFGHVVYEGLFYDEINHEVYWHGQPLVDDKQYQLTTVDHLMFVPFFPTIEIVGEVEFLFPEFIRSVLGNYLEAHYPTI